MVYPKKYISFIKGRYATEGLRITAGILFPSLLMNYFDMLSIGIVMSIGALCVSVADTPGAVKHRVNGMLASSLLVAIISLIIHFTAVNIILQGLVIFVAGFFFSMLTVYGNRSAAVGIAALLIMVLSLQTTLQPRDIWQNTGYILTGGIWYMLYSLLLYRLRPYKFIQQVLADYISEIAAYLKLRGNLYGEKPDYEKTEEFLLQKQIKIDEQQHMLSELIFNTRTMIKESVYTGRVLLKQYMEVTELFESVMTTYQHYPVLHKEFDETGILNEYRDIIYSLAAELEEISFAIKSGNSSVSSMLTKKQIENTRKLFELLRKNFMKDNKIEHFVSLGRILKNLEDLSERISILHLYNNQKINISNNGDEKINAGFLPSQDIRPVLFFNNLNMKSNIFRHALRVAFALLVGFIISYFFKVDRGYWVLLTIVVILKPAYSLSKRRNTDRLIGTALGVITGLLILLVIDNDSILLGLMIIFMLGSFMSFRTNYFLSVLLMTPYLLIFFHFLYPGILRDLMQDRIVDTAIGSAIAFLASLFLVPAWERENITAYMTNMLEANEKYYQVIAHQFYTSEPVDLEPIKAARSASLVALANLSNAFTRMISEPKRYRQGMKNVHRFVVLNHTLISHLASLSYLLQKEKITFSTGELMPFIKNSTAYFKNAGNILLQFPKALESTGHDLKEINKRVEQLLEIRKSEISAGYLETAVKKELVETKSVADQFNYILSDVKAIYKICSEHSMELTNLN